MKPFLILLIIFCYAVDYHRSFILPVCSFVWTTNFTIEQVKIFEVVCDFMLSGGCGGEGGEGWGGGEGVIGGREGIDD